MSKKRTNIKNLITRRAFFASIGMGGGGLLLLSRMFYLQFFKSNEYRTLSDQNRLKTLLVPPYRGVIKDINGDKIVKNKSCFRLLLDKTISNNYSQEADFIIQLLQLNQDQAKEIHQRIKNTGRRIPGLIIDSINWQQVSILEERKNQLKSFFVDLGFKRDYIFAESMAHITGYIGRPTTDEQKDLKLKHEYVRVGRCGVEKYYEKSLRGQMGIKTIEVNAYSQYIRSLTRTEAIAGDDVELNINAKLQHQAFQYLPSKGCSAVMMDCRDGGILVYASAPSYDPNQFYSLSSKYWDSLVSSEYKPLIDKCCRSVYPPGSIFKVVTFLAALESGISPSTEFFCSGKAELGGNSFRCARSRGHGMLNMHDAFKSSCNSYIYAIARRVGPDKIIATAKKLGFGQVTGIDLPGEKAGFVPSRQWKESKHGQKWSLGDTFNLSIGQGFLLVTPLQLTRMMAAIASNGKLFTPSLKKQKNAQYTMLDIAPDHLKFLQAALHSVMNKKGGTGYLSRINHQGQTIAAKTGTAQVIAKKHQFDDLNRDSIAWKTRNHAIFTGYGPYENPKYALTVYFDHGGGGGRSAAPIARKIFLDAL